MSPMRARVSLGKPVHGPREPDGPPREPRAHAERARRVTTRTNGSGGARNGPRYDARASGDGSNSRQFPRPEITEAAWHFAARLSSCHADT